MKTKNLIIGGDFNLTLNRWEVYGSTTHHKRLLDFFLDHYETIRWVDIKPLEVNHTWKNDKARMGKFTKYFG